MKSQKVKNKFNFSEIALKSFNTKIKHRTVNSSKPEKELYKSLVQIFGVDNVFCQYKDSRYPFHCDFYIKNIDLFIELNLYFTHGKHPFDKNNIEDIKLLEKWKSKANTSKFYMNAIEVWTKKDVEKQRLAKENNLNYISLYNNDDINNLLIKLTKENKND